MHQNANVAPLAIAHHDVEATRERRALLADARWEVRRQHGADAVQRLKIGRQRRAAGVEDLTVA